jgi:hypothetical protein
LHQSEPDKRVVNPIKKEEIMDIGSITIKDLLEAKLGAEKTEVVLKVVNNAYEKGARSDELVEEFKKGLRKVDYDVALNPLNIPFMVVVV